VTDLVALLEDVGLELAGPLGPGSEGARWAARDAAGRRWALTIVGAPTPAEVTRLRRRVARLSAVGHPHLAAVGPVAELADGSLAVLAEEIPGTDLESVCAGRGQWSAGEVVTVVVPLAEALAALHDAGLCHGDVAAANVVLRPDGRPVLVDLVLADGPGEHGTPGMAAPERTTGATTGCDVYALARLGLRLLAVAGTQEASADRDALMDCLAAAVDADPARRPGAGELARQVYAVCPPVAVEMPDPAVLARLALRRLADPREASRTVRVPVRRGRHRRPRPARRWALMGVAAVALGACVATATVAGNVAAGSVEVAAAARGGVGPGDPVAAAVRLTVARADALGTGDRVALAAVTVPGSPAARADALTAMRLWRTATFDVAVHLNVERVGRLPMAPASAVRCAGCTSVLLVAGVGTTETTASSEVVLVMQPSASGWRVRAVEAYEP